MWFIYGMLFITTMPKLIIVGQKIKDHFLFTWRPHRPIKKSLNAKLLKGRPCTQIVLITNWCNISIGYNIFYNNILLHIDRLVLFIFFICLFLYIWPNMKYILVGKSCCKHPDRHKENNYFVNLHSHLATYAEAHVKTFQERTNHARNSLKKDQVFE